MLPIETRLRDLAGQENCDGSPYDEMQEAADEIAALRARVRVLEEELKTDGEVSNEDERTNFDSHCLEMGIPLFRTPSGFPR